MAFCNNFSCKQAMTVIGAFLTLTPTSYIYYWGNLSIYTSSYFLFKGVSIANVQSPWILSSFLIGTTISIPIGGCMSLFVGRKVTVMIGIFIGNGCIAVCSYLINASFIAFTISFGFLAGFGIGLSYSSLEVALEWAETSSGLLSALIESSWNVGGAIVNYFITQQVNPIDEPPDLPVGPSMYFSQVNILDRVPGLFLLLGIGSAAVQLIGFCLLRDKSLENQESTINKPMEANEMSAIVSRKESNAGSMQDPLQHILSDLEPERDSDKSYSFKKMFTSKVFLTLWITSSVSETTILVTSNYYKQVGQTHIQDDHLLTVMGTVTILTTIFMRISFGVAIDKLGVRKTFAFLFFSLTILGSFFVLTPLVSKWLYFVVTVFYLGFSGALYNSFAPATVQLLGLGHFTINFGLVWSSSILLNLIAPYVLEYLLMTYGWYTLFQAMAGLAFFGGLAVLKFI